jgi:hypothetical protein
MKTFPFKLPTNTILLIALLLLIFVNGCNSCSKGERIAQQNLKSLKNKLDSLENKFQVSNDKLYDKISKEIEMILIIENEIDGKSKKSHEIKEILKDYK